MALKQIDRHAQSDWDLYLKNIQQETTIDLNLSYDEKVKRLKRLEANPVEWMLEMFPNYAKYPFAQFQKDAINRLCKNLEWYEVLSWSRELAKSTITMMCDLYLMLTGKKKNFILVSYSWDAAVKLMKPYKGNLERNGRIEYYYGEQKGLTWSEDIMLTKKGVSLIAIGAGQSPRGVKNEDVRPDLLKMDDFDTDEECRNPIILENKWNWFEQALYFTRSISEPLMVIWCGNIIAKDCCVKRAGEVAKKLAANKRGNWDIINIRMVNIKKPDPENDFKYGKSVWPEKNTEELINIALGPISAQSIQKECFNNPLSKGDIFKEMVWGKCPPLQHLRFAVAYADPSTSNKDKQKVGNSYKAVFLIGFKEGKFYVYTGFLDQVNNATFVEWFYSVRDYVGNKTQVYNCIENNSLQDPFYEQVFIPLFANYGRKRGMISISPDTRKKPDKFTRIEGNMEPLNRNGQLVLNIEEKDNPHMKRLEDQFLLINAQMKSPADGPDCIEGAVYIINEKLTTTAADSMTTGRRTKNSKRV